jgi:tocopherol O-methyltransferase
MNKEHIIHYYETCESDYRLLWDLDHSHAMHAGYWDDQVKTLREALKRENEILAEIAHIKKGEKVLDAGCGVGGSAIFLAEHYQCEVVGITLSKKQVHTAREKSKQALVEPQPSFQVMDYTCMSFPDHFFDVVWGIESICHAVDKSLFIKEAFRVLKPGGRLIVADGFAMPYLCSVKEQYQMERWLKGWGVQALDTAQLFEKHLKDYGFKNTLFKDVTSHVLPSSKRLYLYSWPAILISKLGELAGWRSNSQTENLHSARCQYQTLKKGLWQYGIFYAEKPTF